MSERELWERERGIRKEREGGGEVERSRAGENHNNAKGSGFVSNTINYVTHITT